MRWARRALRVIACVASIAAVGSNGLAAQNTGQTVRHHTISEPDSSFPPQLVEAEAAIEKRDYPRAESLLDEVVKSSPANYQAWFDLGFVYHASGRAGDAISAYRTSVEAKPDVFESNLNLGLALAAANSADAERYFRAATQLKPKTQPDQGLELAWLSLGRLLEPRAPGEALEAYRKAAALVSLDPEPHLAEAKLLVEQKRFADAEAEYQHALEARANSSEALTGLADLYLRGQKIPQALEILRRLVAVEPNDANAHAELGRVLVDAGLAQQGLDEMEAALKLAPDEASIQDAAADLYAKLGKQKQAQALYQALVAQHPDDARLHDALGKTYLRQRNFAAAQQEFMEAVKLKPDFGEAYGDLGFAADEGNDFERAIWALDARARFLPEVPVTFFVRASAYDHLRDYKRAAENYHRFLDVAGGKYPDQEWQARHRLLVIEPKK
jgi:tetratricopeptide (TPR) repeat protein